MQLHMWTFKEQLLQHLCTSTVVRYRLQAIPEYQLLSFERAAARGGIAAGTSEPDRDHSRNTSAGAANVAGNPEPARRQINTQELSEEGDEPVSPEIQHEHKQ